MNGALLPGTLFLFDTSAAQRAPFVKEIREIIRACIDDGTAATCVTVDLEAVYSARATQAALVAEERVEYFQQLPITEAIAQRARQVQVLLDRRGLHRSVGPVDLLTAAIAEHYRAVILHYDADFEHIAAVTGQRQQWIVPRGSID